MAPPKKKKKRKGRARAAGGGAQAAPAQPARDVEQSQDKRRERLEARREAKAKAVADRQRRERLRRITRFVVTFGVLGFIVWFLFLRNSIPDAIAGHEIEHFDTFATESRAGTLHTGETVSYPSLPPVSGDHRPIPANCGVYNASIPDENMVHTLEHGAVGILYQPDAPLEEIRNIEEIVGGLDSHIFSQPYPNMESEYAVVAWAHRMVLDSYDQEAIEEFVDVFSGGGDAPETNQPCDTTADTPFEPTPSPSPAATATLPPEENANDKEKKKD